MFDAQITAIESEIQSLTDKLNQYRTLENQVESVKQAIAQIQQTAQGLDPEIIPEMFASLELPATNSQTPQQQAEQAQQQSEQLEQAQAEEIATLRQQLLVAERQAKAAKNECQELECTLVNEREILQEEKSSYLQQLKDLENTTAQFVFPSDIESFIRSGKFEFDLAADLQEVVEHLNKTPDWCVKARVKRLWSMACSLVREELGGYLPPNLLWIWQECATTAIPAKTQSEQKPVESEQVTSEQLFNQQLETNQDEKLPDNEMSALSSSASSEEVFDDVFGEQDPTTWINLVEYEDEEEEYELGIDEEAGDDWSAPSTKEDTIQPELEHGDSVQIPSGKICTIENIEFVGIMAYFTLKLPNGKTQSGFRACDFQRVTTGEQTVKALVESSQPQVVQAEEVTGELTEAVNPVTLVPSANSQTALRIGSTVKVPGGRIGEVTCFSTSITGQELVTVEFTSPKRKKKSVEEFPVSKVTVLEEEAQSVSALKDENIGRLCDCPDGRRGRIAKTTKKGRWVEAEVKFDDGTTQEYDFNSLWLLPQEVASSQAA